MESSPSSSNSRGPGLFRLPRNIRNKIYQLVLVIPHPLYLFRDGISPKVELFAPDKPPAARQWLALLHTSRLLHIEAAAALYGSHQFVLVDITTRGQADLLRSFLDRIGPVDAGYLSHICINFPAVAVTASGSEKNAVCNDSYGHSTGQPEEDDDVTTRSSSSSMLQDADFRGLKLIQERCRGLTTLETYVHSKNSRGLVAATATGQGGGVSPHTVRAALAEVEARLKAISSLRKVVIRLYDGPLAPEVAELMQSFGWVVLPER